MALNLGLIKLQRTFRWISSLEEKKGIAKHKIMRYGPVNYGDLQFMSSYHWNLYKYSVHLQINLQYRTNQSDIPQQIITDHNLTFSNFNQSW